MEKPIEEVIQILRQNEKRGFVQTVDLIVNIKNIDLKKPENKFAKKVVLPHGRGKNIDVCVISEKGHVTKNDIEEFGRNKSAAKKFIKKYEFFICEAPLMPLVGKVLGRYLGPKGKMPELLVPGRNPEHMIDELKRSVRIRIRDSPTVQVIIGTESMTDDQIKENTMRVLEEIRKSLPDKAQIKNASIKLTMSKPVRISA